MHFALYAFLLYIGPDQMLPVASALAAAAGVLMIWRQRLINGIRKVARLLRRRSTR